MSEEQQVNETQTEQETNQEIESQEDNKPEYKYTDDDVDEIINQKYAKWQKQKEAEEQKRIEAEKFKNMTADEQTQKRLSDMEKELKAYKEREQLSEMKTVARAYFTDEGISISDSMLSALVTKDADTTKENVSNYIENFKKEVEKGINSKLAGKTPTVQKSNPNSTKTRDEILSVKDTAKRRQLIAENPDLFL